MGSMEAGPLFASVVTGAVGLAMLVYGKKSGRVWWLLFGLLMCVLPYVLHSTGLIWTGAVGCVVGAMALERIWA